MKKSVLVRLSCLALASAVLLSALAVAAYLGSPYETLKRAVLDAMVVRNVTIETRAAISINGELYQEEKSFEVHGDNGFLVQYFDDDGQPASFSFMNDNLHITRGYMADDDTEWYFANIWARHRTVGHSSFISLTPEDRHSTQVRFVELLADALVGNLKNNITMSSQNGVRRVQAMLTESQVPELVKIGIALAVEQSSIRYYHDRREIGFNGSELIWETVYIHRDTKTITTWKQPVRAMTDDDRAAMEDGSFWDDRNNHYGTTYFNGVEYVITSWQEVAHERTEPATPADFDERNPLNMPLSELTLHYARGEAEIDSDGNLLSVEVSGSATAVDIFGKSNLIELRASVRFSDIGTSDPESPIPGASELLTPEFIRELTGFDHGNVYFKLNENGGIDMSSVTTTHPGEIYGWGYENAYISAVAPRAFGGSVRVTESVLNVETEVAAERETIVQSAPVPMG
jgi:hypothetical protein